MLPQGHVECAAVDFVSRVAAPGRLIVRVGRDERQRVILDPLGLGRAHQVVGRVERHVDIGGKELRRPSARGRRNAHRHGNVARGRAAATVAHAIGERIAAGIACGGRVTDAAVLLQHGRAVLRLRDRRHRERIAIGIAVAGQHIDRRRLARIDQGRNRAGHGRMVRAARRAARCVVQQIVGGRGRRAPRAAIEAERQAGARRERGIPSGIFDDVLIAGLADDRRIPNRSDRAGKIKLQLPIGDRLLAGVLHRDLTAEAAPPIASDLELSARGRGRRRNRVQDCAGCLATRQRGADRIAQRDGKALARGRTGLGDDRHRDGLLGLTRRKSQCPLPRPIIGARLRSAVGRGVGDGHGRGRRRRQRHVERGVDGAARAIGHAIVGNRERRHGGRGTAKRHSVEDVVRRCRAGAGADEAE